MGIRLVLLSSVLLAALASGCTSNDPGPGVQTPDAEAGPTDAAGGSPDDAAASSAAGSVRTKTFEGSWEVGYSVADQDNTMLGTNWPEYQAPGGVTAVVVEMEWTAATPTADRLTLYVAREDRSYEASGTSPLRLVFEGAEASGPYRMAAVGGQDPGTYVHQAVTFHATAFDGTPLDPAFSAVGA